MARYRMTPRRKAALRKAQAASARKRRRRIATRIGIGVGVVGAIAATGVAGYGARSYVRQLAGGGPKRPGKELVHVRGKGTFMGAPVRKYPKQGNRSIKRAKGAIFKTDKKGRSTLTTKRRVNYDSNRRRQYWHSKPVAR